MYDSNGVEVVKVLIQTTRKQMQPCVILVLVAYIEWTCNHVFDN